MDLFKKSIVVGVSVTPDIGLEVAQIDFANQTVLKYGLKQLDYDKARREIADLDLFKEALQDLFFELDIPKGAEVVLNIPTIVLKTNDYPASLDAAQISSAVEEELAEHFIFNTVEPIVSAVKIPTESIQFSKIAYTAAQKQTMIEIAMGIKDLGYKLHAIDTSANSVLNALMYTQRVDVTAGKTWLLLMVDGLYCRIFSMNGKRIVDTYEEKISIGQVLDDAENYSTVINAVAPILKNVPSSYLFVVSKTNIISAEALAGKLTYSAPIIHQEANCFSKGALLRLGQDIDEKFGNIISLDVIGAAIYPDFQQYSDMNFNLFNESMGDIYLLEQPLKLPIGNGIALTNAFLIKLFILCALVLIVPFVTAYSYFSSTIAAYNAEIQELEKSEAQINKFLKDNENISSEMFDEGDEIRMGLVHNKAIYSYYTIVGTEIPKKLWLTSMNLSDKTTIKGQADNLESVYAFFRSIKDYDPNSAIKLQKLGLAAKSDIQLLDSGEFDTDSVLTSLNADFYEFVMSDDPSLGNAKPNTNAKKESKSSDNALPGGLEPIGDSN